MSRREHGTGSAYQRTSDWRWIGTVEAGFTADTGRRRKYVTGKGCAGGCPKRCAHRTAFAKKLRDLNNAKESGNLVAAPSKTVKQWADEYAQMRLADLRPKAYNAAMNPIKNWVVPTIGHRRLSQLTAADIRAVDDAQRKAGRQPNDTRRTMMTMLKAAVREGHQVPQVALLVKAPPIRKSDRTGMSVDEGIACLAEVAKMPDGSRWLFTLLYGQRMGECLGLTWDAIGWDTGEFGEAVIEWQLQALPYNVPRDRSSGFRVPDGHEARHLVDAYHLVRPKSDAGFRVAPFLPFVRAALLKWRDVAPANPYDLVWPDSDGTPRNDKHDRAAWHELQQAAGVHHPTRKMKDGTPAPYHVHECRNFAATMLLEAGVDDHVITALLGHSALAQSLKYKTVRREPLLDAMTRVGQRLQLG